MPTHACSLRISLAALLCGVTVGALPAQDSGNRPQQLFAELDQNSDGVLTAEEVGEQKANMFRRLVTLGDKDDDGRLTEAEFVAALTPPAEAAPVVQERPNPEGRGRSFADGLFRRFDANQDGKLTKDEIPEEMRERFAPIFARAEKDELTAEEFLRAMPRVETMQRNRGGFPSSEEFFGQLDRNQDGQVTLEELPAPLRERLAPAFKELGKDAITQEDFARVMAQRRREGQGPPEGGRGPGGPAIFSRLDEDGDGRLSKTELAKITERFEELDADKDGQLDPREFFGFGPPRDGAPGGFGRGRTERPGDGGRPDRPRRPSAEGTGERPATPQRNTDRRPQGATFVDRFFETFDADGDGLIPRADAPQRLQENFDRIDADGDGSISRAEFQNSVGRARRD